MDHTFLKDLRSPEKIMSAFLAYLGDVYGEENKHSIMDLFCLSAKGVSTANFLLLFLRNTPFSVSLFLAFIFTLRLGLFSSLSFFRQRKRKSGLTRPPLWGKGKT